MTDRLVDSLFLITGALLPPVLIALAVMAAAMLWMLGGLAREALERSRRGRRWRSFLAEHQAGRAGIAEFLALPLSGEPARFQARLRGTEWSPPAAKKCLDDVELDIARRLSLLAFAIRVGPMLGLVGTLLPLGPALRGLASDDLQSLAANLEIAFTTTVFGLLIGGLAYGASLVRRNWYEQDLSDLESLLEPPHRQADSNNGARPEAAHA